jgi:hypothetical protein
MKRWLLLLTACTHTTELVPPRADAAVVDAQLSLPDAGVQAPCGNGACACSNGIDDDLDGLRDGFDPECSAPFDNREDSFAIGAHGEDQDTKCQDCFFDDDSGGECKRARSCALDGTPASGTGACRSCTVEPSCKDSCLPRVPNGCDCYGCCEVWRDGARLPPVLLTQDCSLANLTNPDVCTPCTPAIGCVNPCETCELCTGRTLQDLPASCGNAATCEGAVTCASEADCPSLHYCLQGCCVPTTY